MAKGILYLVDLLNSGNDQIQGITPKQFVHFLREGMQNEPERFPQLVEAVEAQIQRYYPDWSPYKVRQRALGNISGFACMADHDYETEMMRKSATGGPKTVAEWYDNPQEYGVAMTAFVDYVGVKGPSLREWILDL